MKIERLDHIVLTVRDVERTCDFYQRVLGMDVIDFEHGRRALRFGDQKINLHPFGREFEPKASVPTPGSADLCLIAETPVAEVAERIQAMGVDLLLPPHPRTGALGPIESIYVYDPDGNLVEIANYVTGDEPGVAATTGERPHGGSRRR